MQVRCDAFTMVSLQRIKSVYPSNQTNFQKIMQDSEEALIRDLLGQFGNVFLLVSDVFQPLWTSVRDVAG